MSATVMYYPEEYINLLPTMQARITAGRPSSYADNVRVGVSLNFDKLCACVLQVCGSTSDGPLSSSPPRVHGAASCGARLALLGTFCLDLDLQEAELAHAFAAAAGGVTICRLCQGGMRTQMERDELNLCEPASASAWPAHLSCLAVA